MDVQVVVGSQQRLSIGGHLQLGRFDRRPFTADPLEGAPWPMRWLRRTRLKEWVGFLVIHPEWCSSAGLDC